MFVDYGPTQYWSTSSAPPYTSALGYMPEAAWNQGRLSTTDLDATSTGTVTGSGIVSTGGGVSIDTARPSWQTGSQIPSQADPPGSAAGGTLPGLHRLVPDVVMLASFGHNGTLYCGVGMCQGSGSSSSIGVVGGTSVSAPAMASAQALINQRNGGRQGNVNYIYYALAARQSAAGTHCDSTNGTPANPTVTLPDSSCDFHDIVTGSNLVPLSQNNSLAIGFSAASGYDEATGLGSINIANLANDWSSATFHATQTTFTLAPATGVTHGSAQAFTIGVTSAYASGTATPAGNVTLITSSLNAAGAPQVYSLSAGTASGSIATLPAGTYTVHAHYDGDGIFAPSDSAPVAVSIAPEGSIVTLTPKRVDAVGNKVATSSFTYGDALVALDVSVTAHSGNGTPTGTLTYTLQGPGSLPTLTQPLNSAGATALLSGPSYAGAGLLANYPTLPAGLYTATAAYAGDSNFTVSATTSSFTVAKAASVLQLTASQTAPLTGGSPITFTLSIATPPSASAATGTAQLIDTANGVPLCTITLNAGTALCTTSALQTAGTHAVAATYAGDANYLPASATPLQIVVTSTSQPTASLVLTGLSTTFDGTAHSVGVLTTPAGLASTVTYNGAASPPTAAGTYTVVATVHNGSVSETTTGTLRIAKATPVLTWPGPLHLWCTEQPFLPSSSTPPPPWRRGRSPAPSPGRPPSAPCPRLARQRCRLPFSRQTRPTSRPAPSKQPSPCFPLLPRWHSPHPHIQSPPAFPSPCPQRFSSRLRRTPTPPSSSPTTGAHSAACRFKAALPPSRSPWSPATIPLRRSTWVPPTAPARVPPFARRSRPHQPPPSSSLEAGP